MLLKTILNRIERHSSFVYGEPKFENDALVIPIRPRSNRRGVCSGCGVSGGTYDTAREPRRFQFVPLWGIAVFFLYSMRRVNCAACGVKVESVPWAQSLSEKQAVSMKEIARSMRNHRPLILNWFRTRGEISSGAVEGLNNKLKLTFRRSYGFRTLPAAKTALYHAMGRLPEPEQTHRFC